MFPFFEVFGRKIPTYGLSIVIAIILVCFCSYRRIRKDKSIPSDAAPPEYMLAVVSACMVSFLVGAKLLYIIVSYDPADIVEMIKNFDFSFLKEAGLVFYGGLIFGIIGSFAVARWLEVDLLRLERHIVPFIPMGHGIGRIGCLLGGCCYGVKYSGFGAVHYENSLVGLSPHVGYFPVQPLESILDMGIMAFLLVYTKKERRKGDVLAAYLLLYAIMRFCTEFFRGDSHRGIFSGISTSQWISIGLVAVVAIRFVILKVKSKKIDLGN